MPFVFSQERWRAIAQRRDQVHATLLPASDRMRPNTVRHVWREYVAHDEDGEPIGTQRQRVNDVVGGELRPALLTIVSAKRVDVTVEAVGSDLARACGYSRASGLCAAWLGAHPRSPLALAVYFVLGDHRDLDVYMNWTGRAGGDYTRNGARALDRDAPCLTPGQYQALGMAAQQRDAKRRATASVRLASESDYQRLRRIEAATSEMTARFARETRVIEDRIARMERYRGAA